ncbi:WxL domain-containing protein [Listeria rustica]|uniref:WxL domain-containing protein n=1 Tax=Listeria rustica TaxID=2713503 RepID=A0A7W1T6A7_9LIST|nr:WxL domain-containing protein [Listeria rustica]MBA3926217.1 WxL domain-containing protein [Listeria rustica]
MTFKKFAVIGLVTVSAVAATLGMGNHASAAEVGSVTTNGKVKFTKQAEGSVTPPVNPLDPDKTIDPDGGEGTGTTGPLNIAYVSSFDFGTQEISGETKTYNAKLDTVKVDGQNIEVPNSVQVADNRGNNAGWNLTVSQGGQLKDGSARNLEGAQIALKKGTAVTKTGTGVTAPTSNQNITLNPNGTASMVMNAGADQGMGQWVNKFGADNTAAVDAVTLTVPGKSAKYADSDYTTTLTWTLSDTPE